MAKSITAINLGFDYQAVWFNIQLCRLFELDTTVQRVGYELNGPKAFDDVAVFYKPNTQRDEKGQQLWADFYQVKFHIRASGAISWDHLMDPEYINASSKSLLQRLRDAQSEYAPDGSGSRFILFTPDGILPNTELADVYSNRDGSIVWENLAEGGDRSRMGQIRSMLREHLEIGSDTELQKVLKPFRIHRGNTLQELKQDLNISLLSAGYKPVQEASDIHPYIALTVTLLEQCEGPLELDRKEVEIIYKRNRLWQGHRPYPAATKSIGVRSFTRYSQYMDEKVDNILDLRHHFNNRYIISPDLWNTAITKDIEHFLALHIGTEAHHEALIYIDAHASIAFAAGYCLDSKSGVKITPIQKTAEGMIIWDTHSTLDNTDYEDWHRENIVLSGDLETGVALALSVTHDIVEDVGIYITKNCLQVGRIICCTLPHGASNTAIMDGVHARLLAQSLAKILKTDRTPKERLGRLHIFSAAPNGLMFFLGQVARSFGEIALYEYDFSQNIPGAYEQSIALPF